MRILSLSNCPPDDRLGSGYVVLRSAEGLRRAGHEVDLYGPADYEPLHGVARGRAVGYRQVAGMAAKSLARIARVGYDVVELWGATAWLALDLLARVPNRRFLLVCRSNGLEPHYEEAMREAEAAGDVPPSRPWYHVSQSARFAKALRRADGVITVSAWDRDWALARGIGPDGRVLVVENPLPDSFLGQEPDLDRGPVLGYCGSWLAVKGVKLLAEALPGILWNFPEWRLRLVGVGTGFRVEDHFPADVLPRIDVVPFADRETGLRDLYRSFAIALQPSVFDSFGLAAAEAMACGAALVATRVGFAAGLRHGEEAWLLSDRSPAGLQAALRELMRDGERRRALARGGHRRVQALRQDRAAAAVEAAYHEWLAARRRKAAA
jgi:glycosyltransferase involved in cell wall biosynthesis